LFPLPVTTLICDPDKAKMFLTEKVIVETEVDCLLGNETSRGAEIDEIAMQYEMEHSEADGGLLLRKIMSAM
jgi:hypothetical protein